VGPTADVLSVMEIFSPVIIAGKDSMPYEGDIRQYLGKEPDKPITVSETSSH
jgi:hypothetical protein